MTATITPTLTTIPARSGSATTPVWRVGAVAAVAAAVATTVVALTAKAIDIPMKAAASEASVAKAIPLSGFALGTLLATAIGTILAVILARRAQRPVRLFVVITSVLTLASFFGPITTSHATTATRLVLAFTHVVAAAIVIPALSRRLAEQPTRR
jgi:hypothetical protein